MTVYKQGAEGSFWSSSADIDGDVMIGLKVGNGSVFPTVDGQRDEGWAVRCAYYQH